MAELMKILRALSNETRYQLVKLLVKHDFCVVALATRLHISESAVSHQHLKVLRNASIVKGDKRRYYPHYYVDRETLKRTSNKIIELSHVIPVDRECYRNISLDNFCCIKEEKNVPK